MADNLRSSNGNTNKEVPSDEVKDAQKERENPSCTKTNAKMEI